MISKSTAIGRGPRCTTGSSSFLSRCLLVAVAVLTTTAQAQGQAQQPGGELATLTVSPLDYNQSFRQTVCDRYDLVLAEKLELRDALQNMSLHPLMAIGDFFNYSHTTGIHPTDPGLMADILDDLAQRAGFTWRQSFAVMEPPEVLNITWTNMLLWGVETYDIGINWWDLSVERMEKGVAYIEPWFDGSIVLIDRMETLENTNVVNLWNWTRPFEGSVWILAIFTILVSAVIYQFLEYMDDECHERTRYQWFSDNLYLSSLNFTQNFEYAPNSASARLFAVSMGIWAMVMTATYTANLASLFVEAQSSTEIIDSIDLAIANNVPICTFGNTNADFLIKEQYKNADRRPKVSELEMIRALKAGECGLAAGYKDNWLGHKGNSKYNPDCDLEWVGREAAVIKSGFAVKADVGHLCTSFIRDVLNLYMLELAHDGKLLEAWEKHRSKTKDIDCVAENAEDSDRNRRLLLRSNNPQNTRKKPAQQQQQHVRSLKAAGKTASGTDDTTSLTIQQMAGTFVLHYGLMMIAVITRLMAYYYERWSAARNIQEGRIPDVVQERQIFRTHGPIIGSAPRVNTSLLRASTERDLEGSLQELGTSYSTGVVERDDPYADMDRSTPDKRRVGMSRIQSHRSSVAVANMDNSNVRQRRRMSSTVRNSVDHEEWREAHNELALQMNQVLSILNNMSGNEQRSSEIPLWGKFGLASIKESKSSREAPF